MFTLKFLLLTTAALSSRQASALPPVTSSSSSSSDPNIVPSSSYISPSPATPTLSSSTISSQPSLSPDPHYNTSYGGRVKDADWVYYRNHTSPAWWNANLDSITGIACRCRKTEDSHTTKSTYQSWTYHSLVLNKNFTLHSYCEGLGKHERKVVNRCWDRATGHGRHSTNEQDPDCVGQAFDDEFCVKAEFKGKRWMSWNAHMRYFDQKGTHQMTDNKVTEKTCKLVCQDKLQMDYDTKGHHHRSFVTTFYPPKPIPFHFWP